MLSSYPNPVNGVSTIKYSVDAASHIRVAVFDATGRLVKILVDKKTEKGVYTVQWNAAGYPKGNYMINATKDGAVKQTIGVVKN
jgi:flagellar hook assembly protein FlgD